MTQYNVVGTGGRSKDHRVIGAVKGYLREKVLGWDERPKDDKGKVIHHQPDEGCVALLGLKLKKDTSMTNVLFPRATPCQVSTL